MSCSVGYSSSIGSTSEPCPSCISIGKEVTRWNASTSDDPEEGVLPLDKDVGDGYKNRALAYAACDAISNSGREGEGGGEEDDVDRAGVRGRPF
jgi:hypothetical protein